MKFCVKKWSPFDLIFLEGNTDHNTRGPKPPSKALQNKSLPCDKLSPHKNYPPVKLKGKIFSIPTKEEGTSESNMKRLVSWKLGVLKNKKQSLKGASENSPPPTHIWNPSGVLKFITGIPSYIFLSKYIFVPFSCWPFYKRKERVVPISQGILSWALKQNRFEEIKLLSWH